MSTLWWRDPKVGRRDRAWELEAVLRKVWEVWPTTVFTEELLNEVEAALAEPDAAAQERDRRDAEPELVIWFHESEEICPHDDAPWPCQVMADHLLRAFDVAPRITKRPNGTFAFEGRHFHRLAEYTRLLDDVDNRSDND